MRQISNQKGQNHRHCDRECLTEPVRRLITLLNLILTMHPKTIINMTTKACAANVKGLETWAALDKAELDDGNWAKRVNEDRMMCV